MNGGGRPGASLEAMFLLQMHYFVLSRRFIE